MLVGLVYNLAMSLLSKSDRTIVVLVLLLALLASACGRQESGSGRPAVPTRSAEATGLPAATATTLQPAATNPPPAATVTMPLTEAASPSPDPAGCRIAYFFEPAPDSCPAAEPVPSAAAEQPFENGVMIWLAESDSIIVFFADGRWQRFEDTWSEGQPESDPDLVPPVGRFQPIRGFGKLWREQPGLRESLGWALGVELGYDAVFQDRSAAPDRPPQSYLLTYNGQVFALIQRAPDEGDWVVAADNR